MQESLANYQLQCQNRISKYHKIAVSFKKSKFWGMCVIWLAEKKKRNIFKIESSTKNYCKKMDV